MFNLRADLKIYTCDKYLLGQKILKAAVREGDRYRFQVIAKIGSQKHSYNNGYENVIKFTPKGMSESLFREFLELAGINLNSIENISTFHQWSQANPTKTWTDFQSGIEANLSLPVEKLDAAFEKIRPDQLMNDLALSPNSQIAKLIGKKTSDGYGYRRRRHWREDRENQLVRLWALFGNEVAISASTAQLESILTGIQLHDFGINHCENMQALIEHVNTNVKAYTDKPDVLAAAIKQLDAMIAKFGGKPIERSRPRSPFFRQVYDILAGKPFNPNWNASKANDIAS